MDQDGLTGFFEAIKVEMEDPVTLVIAHAMGVKESSRIEYSMFQKGCKALNADSVEKWQRLIPALRNDFASNSKLHKEVYEFAYVFSCEPGLKTIDKEMACALWPMFLQDKC